jgi:hypothetical protein
VLRRMVGNVNRESAAPDGRAVELGWGAAELGASLEDAPAAADVALLEQKTEQRR